MTQNLDTIVQVKLPTGQVVDIVNWSDKPVYSSADLQNGFVAEEIDFFQYVVGRVVTGYGNPLGPPPVRRTATDADTNVQVAGEMSTMEELLVYAIKPEFFLYTTPVAVNDFSSRSYMEPGIDDASPCDLPIMRADALAILQSQLILRLNISEKNYAEAGLGYFNTGFGVFAPGVAATAGQPQQNAVRSYTLPHHIGAQEKYRAQLINPGGNPCNFAVDQSTQTDPCVRVVQNDMMVTIRLNLDGLYKRPTA